MKKYQGSIPEDIKKMIENPGVYVCGDVDHPEATVVLISKDGKIYSMKIDNELDPTRFLDSRRIKGPYVGGPMPPLSPKECLDLIRKLKGVLFEWSKLTGKYIDSGKVKGKE